MITRTELINKLTTGAVWNTGVTFERTNPVPIDKYSIFSSLADAQAYAFENPVAYPGQTLAVVTDTNKVTLYVIQANAATAEASLAEVGSATLGDGVSVELTTDKKLKIKDFGTKYYAQSVADDGTVSFTLVESFKAGLEPRVRLNEDTGAFEIAWYEPSTTTVEGLSKTVDSLADTVASTTTLAQGAKDTADKNKQDIEALTSTVEGHTTSIGAAEAAIAALQQNTYNKTQVDEKIAAQAHFSSKIVDTTNEVTEENVIYLIKDTTATGQDVYREYILVDGVPTCIGDTSTNLADYYTSARIDELLAAKADADHVASEIVRVEGLITNVDNKFANYTTSEDLATTLGEYAKTSEVDEKVKVATDAAAANKTLIDGLTTTVGENTANIAGLVDRVDEIDQKLVTVNDEIAGVKQSITELGNTYATDAEVAAIRTEIEDAHAESVAAIEATLAGKANASEVYTKNDVDTKLGDYATTDSVDTKIAEIFGTSENLADYIADNRNTLPGLLSEEQQAAIEAVEGQLNSLKINSTDEITATSNEAGGVDLTIGKVGVSKLESDVTLYLNCGDAETV